MSMVMAPEVLVGVKVCTAFSDGPINVRLRELGAEVESWPLPAASGEEADSAGAEAAAALPAIGIVVVDAGESFRRSAGAAAVDRLRATIDDAFVVLRSVANASWIEPQSPGGKIVLVAPSADDGEHATAAAAALENTARTLSVEWARYGIRVVAIVPRAGATEDSVAELIAFLASPAGDYFSGCALRPGDLA